MEDPKKLLWVLAQQNSHSVLIAAGWTPGDLKAAGWTPGALKAAGWTPGALIAAGWTPGDLEDYEKDFNSIPVIEKPYSKIWNGIQERKILHDQSTFGPEKEVEESNICNTPMCTAGNLVQMAGAYRLVKKYNWRIVASMVHQRSTSKDLPEQNYGSIGQRLALAFLEENARLESEIK